MARPTASSLSLFSVTGRETTSPRTRLRRSGAEICRRSCTSLTSEGSAAGAIPGAASSVRRVNPNRLSARARPEELMTSIITHSETVSIPRRAGVLCYRGGMLNRKFADLRHAPELDPRLVRYDPAGLPQAVVGIGPNASVKTKGGAVLARPGFTWGISFFPARGSPIASVSAAGGQRFPPHAALCVPPEGRD